MFRTVVGVIVATRWCTAGLSNGAVVHMDTGLGNMTMGVHTRGCGSMVAGMTGDHSHGPHQSHFRENFAMDPNTAPDYTIQRLALCNMRNGMQIASSRSGQHEVCVANEIGFSIFFDVDAHH